MPLELDQWSSCMTKHSQIGQRDQGNHARLFVREDQQYHAAQQYLQVQGYQKNPAKKEKEINALILIWKGQCLTVCQGVLPSKDFNLI